MLYKDLVSRSIICESFDNIEMWSAQYRSKKSYIQSGPSLHIFVVTLRCDHSCPYCQVSRQSSTADKFNMSEDDAKCAVDRVFESPSRFLTIEFQGGESLLAFDRIQQIVELVEKRNEIEKRDVRFVIASTGHFLTYEILKYMNEHKIALSTSLDGPERLHNANRPNKTKDSYKKTIDSIAFARQELGISAVSALTTLTKASLEIPEEIVDTYVANKFSSIFLRPLSPYGFAVKSERKIGYTTADFMKFYARALGYILKLNISGVHIDEAYTSLLLKQILTPFSHNYVDLRSPAGAGLAVLVYNYDGKVYAADEARMLAEMGDESFCVGNVRTPYSRMLQSDGMKTILLAGLAEAQPGCSDCVYLPYCGADPVHSYATQRDPVGHRPTSAFCERQTGQFQIIFKYLREREPNVYKVFLAWISGNRAVSEILQPGFMI